MTEYKKPFPTIDEDSLPFWEAARQHKLVIQKCKNCGAFHFTASYCIKCEAGLTSPWAENMEWVEASGLGKVHTFTIAHQPFNPAFKEDVPYNIAVIELDEGPWMYSNIVDCKNEDIKVGMRVKVCFEDVAGDTSIPHWKPLK